MKILAILIILTLLISGCAQEITNQKTGESSTDEFGSDISDLENFENELNSPDDINLNELDF